MRVRADTNGTSGFVKAFVVAVLAFFVVFAILIPLLLIAISWDTETPGVDCRIVANKLLPECLASTIEECFDVYMCAAPFCAGLEREFYTGPSNTLDVGACHAGTEQCFNASIVIVVPEETPAAEVCTNATLDRNCNGLPGCLDPVCFSNPFCADDNVTFCILTGCSEAFCVNASRNCTGACTVGLEGCDASNVPYNCTAPLEVFPPVGDTCSTGSGFCLANGTYQCDSSGNGTVCVTNVPPGDVSVVNVITVDEYSTSTWIFEINANFSLCNDSNAELFSYIVRYGWFSPGGEDSAAYMNVYPLDVQVTGDCTLNPDFFDYGTQPDLDAGEFLVPPVEPVAFLNSPVVGGSCNIIITADSAYFHGYGSYEGGEFGGCVIEAANTTQRNHEVAVVINGNTVSESVAPFTRCPVDMKHQVSINEDAPSPLRIRSTFGWAVFDYASSMSMLMTSSEFAGGPLVNCILTASSPECIAFGTSGQIYLISSFTSNLGIIASLPSRCIVTSSCLFSAPPGDFSTFASTFVVNSYFPRVGPYKDSSTYGFDVFGHQRFETSDPFPPPSHMIIQQSTTNNITLSGVTFTAAPNCDDGILNQDETDIDCGGLICLPCVNGDTCTIDDDCMSRNCTGTCV
jgi:hypothetical protein